MNKRRGSGLKDRFLRLSDGIATLFVVADTDNVVKIQR
jgi:hypothetical protein